MTHKDFKLVLSHAMTTGYLDGQPRFSKDKVVVYIPFLTFSSCSRAGGFPEKYARVLLGRGTPYNRSSSRTPSTSSAQATAFSEDKKMNNNGLFNLEFSTTITVVLHLQRCSFFFARLSQENYLGVQSHRQRHRQTR